MVSALIAQLLQLLRGEREGAVEQGVEAIRGHQGGVRRGRRFHAGIKIEVADKEGPVWIDPGTGAIIEPEGHAEVHKPAQLGAIFQAEATLGVCHHGDQVELEQVLQGSAGEGHFPIARHLLRHRTVDLEIRPRGRAGVDGIPPRLDIRRDDTRRERIDDLPVARL